MQYCHTFPSLFLFFHNCQLLILFCQTLYIQHNIALIIKVKAHLLLIVGNKIVTKKTKKSLCGGLHVQR